MSEGDAALRGVFAPDSASDDSPALPLDDAPEPLARRAAAGLAQTVSSDGGAVDGSAPLERARSLVPADFQPPQTGPLEAAMRLAYRLGVPGPILAAPLRRPASPRLLATVHSRYEGDRAAGVALRAGHFVIHGSKLALTKVDFGSHSRLTPPAQRAVHSFSWLRDLAACAPREHCASTAEQLTKAWLAANPEPGKGPAWSVERAGQRLMNWLVHAPLILSGDGAALRSRVLGAIETTARWLDRRVAGAEDRLGEVVGWCAIVAAGLLLPDGKPRRLFAEAGLLRALGELVGDDGGVLSRSPSAQIDALVALIELRACYDAVDRDPPATLDAMIALLVPALLALRMGDGGLGSWQGSAALAPARLAALIEASGVRARPPRDLRHWGYQRARMRDAVLVMDAAPPPRARHARTGCASTLAFEFSHGDHRLIVNCGGAELAGGLVPLRIEQGLRGTAAHSTLVLDDANSTAVLIAGKLGKGVEEVDFERVEGGTGTNKSVRLAASHNGYAARHGLLHRRTLTLAQDGRELRGEDLLEPSSRNGKRGKIGFAIRFHLGRGVECEATEDRRGAGLAAPDGSYWQFRLGGGHGGDGEAQVEIEDSLWVDGQGRPQATKQIVVTGLADRGGGHFPWLLKRMG